MTKIQTIIEKNVTNGAMFPESRTGYVNEHDLDKLNAQFAVESGRAKARGPKYIGVYNPESDTTFGESEHGPWEVPGDKRAIKTDDYVLIV